jgi:predicted RNA-binding Zn-ribbon protein involved in translation (DUF1610 family)
MESREGHTPDTHTAPGQIGPGAFAGSTATTQSPRRSEVALHICPDCAGELVHPTEWCPASDRKWAVELRCPSCEWAGRGIYTQDVVDRFEEALDLGTDAILADLQALSRANMEEEVERFSRALEAGLILPEDF